MALMNAVDPRVSFTELQQWPDDGRRYELYDGEVIVVPAPFPRHQRVAIKLEQILGEYEQATGGMLLHSPIDIVFTEYDVLQPDIVFFRPERRHLIHMLQATRIPPDLAVEVLSRSTEARDRGRKMELFARFRVPEYWIVDPIANTIEIYTLEAGGYSSPAMYAEQDQVHSPALPGLTFAARRVFED